MFAVTSLIGVEYNVFHLVCGYLTGVILCWPFILFWWKYKGVARYKHKTVGDARPHHIDKWKMPYRKEASVELISTPVQHREWIEHREWIDKQTCKVMGYPKAGSSEDFEVEWTL